MAKRKYRRKKKTPIFAYVISFLFICLLLVLFFSWGIKIHLNKPHLLTGNLQTTSWNIAKVKKLKVYNNMVISGTGLIKEIPYNMQVATSYELVFSGKKFFAKSDDYLLWNYLNQKIQFSGTVVGFSPDNIPVLNVSFIKQPKENQEDEKIEIERKNKYFNKDWLIINLENIPGDFQVCDSGSVVYVCEVNQLSWQVSTWDNSDLNLTWIQKIPYVKISFFKCNNNCKATKKQFERLGFNKFVNDNGVTFYKLPETDDYEVLNDEYGYYFKPLKQNIYFLINAFSLVDTKKLKLDVIKNTCKNDQIQLENILDINSTWDTYNVVWVDTNANKVLCVLDISKSDNGYVWKLKKLDFLRDNTSTQTINEDDYLVYKSRWYGYKVYMPKSVKYESKLINENFGISGLDCKQVVNIADWKTWKLSDPDVKIYYCKSQLSKELVENGLAVNYQNYKVISKQNKMFIVFYKNTLIAKKILNYLKLY